MSLDDLRNECLRKCRAPYKNSESSQVERGLPTGHLAPAATVGMLPRLTPCVSRATINRKRLISS